MFDFLKCQGHIIQNSVLILKSGNKFGFAEFPNGCGIRPGKITFILYPGIARLSHQGNWFLPCCCAPVPGLCTAGWLCHPWAALPLLSEAPTYGGTRRFRNKSAVVLPSGKRRDGKKKKKEKKGSNEWEEVPVLLQIHSGQLAERRSPLPITSNEPGVTILYNLEVSFWKKPLWILVFSLKEKEKKEKKEEKLKMY